MEFGLLGPVVVRDDAGRSVGIGGPLPRALLAVLLLAEGRLVTSDALLDQLWDGAPPEAAQATLHSTISRLRKVLEPHGRGRSGWEVLRSDSGGYRLSVPREAVDVFRFSALADAGRRALDRGAAAEALRHLEDAEALWRGPALAEFADRSFARAAAAGLDERRLSVAEDRFDAELRLGRHDAVLGEVGNLAEAHPLRERLQQLLALALYRSGRQADALAALDRTRRLLREELGLDPGAPLRELEAAILRQDPDLQPPVVPPPPASAEPAVAAGTLETAPPVTIPRQRSPLVGRDVENGRLRALVAEAMAGATRFALVEGEPGIGKTRMLEEMAAVATVRGATVVWGRCSEADRAPAYWPWLEVLRGLLPDAGKPVDSIGDLLGNDAAADDTEVRRFALFEAVAGILRSAARSAPLVVLIEDLHWSDLPSAELLAHLANRLHDVPVALLVSLRELEIGRSDAVAAAVAAISRRTASLRIELRGLPAAAAPALIVQAAGTEVSPEVVGAVHRRAEGNPFCIAELTRLLVAEKALDDPAAVDRAEVPAGVRDVVRRRLAALPDATRALLETFAVIGREADLPILLAASGLDLDVCLDALEPALTTRVLVPVPETPGRHRFAHALMREAALSDVSSLRAARLHAKVADAVLTVVGDSDATAEIVANHLWAAAPLVGAARAAASLERAAEVALRQTAYENADDLLDRALAVRRSAGGDPDSDVAELQTTLALMRLRRARRGYTGAVSLVPLDRPKELARRTGRLDLYQGLLLVEFGAAGTGGDIARTVEVGSQVREIGRQSDDPVLRWLGEHVWAVTCWHIGRLYEASRVLLDVQEFVEPLLTAADRVRLAEKDLTLFAGFAVHILDLSGAIDDADRRFADLDARFDDPYDRVVVANFAGVSAAARDEPASVLTATGRVVTEQIGRFAFFGSTCELYQAWAVAVTTDPEGGLARLEAALARYRTLGTRTSMAFLLYLRLTALAAAGRPAPVLRAALTEAETELEGFGELWPLPYLDVARARVALVEGDRAAALRHLDDAVDGGRQTGVARVVELAESLRAGLHAPAVR